MIGKTEKEIEKVFSKILKREKIASIDVEGNRRIGKDAILLRATTRIGDDYSPHNLREDIREINKLGYFEDVQVEVSDKNGGKAVVFVIKEKPTVREVLIVGNNKLDTDEIRESITLQPQSILNYKVLKDTVAKIKKLYQENGYYAAKVSYELKDLEGNQKGVVLRIEEGEKFWIKTISFEGNKHFKDKKLKKYMQTKEKGILHWFTGSGVLDQEALRQDVERLSAFYFNNGFIRHTISTPKIDYDEQSVYISIAIDEGDPYTVSTIRLEGDLLESEELMKKNLRMKEGDLFSRDQLRRDILKLTDRYSDIGYAYAEVKPETTIREEDKTVSIVLTVAKKQKVRIGRINIRGNTTTRDKVIRREILLSEGDTFSSSALKKSNRSLHRLRYFEEINISPTPGQTEDIVDLNMEVKEKQTNRFSFGAGYSSIDSLIGMAEVEFTNLFGRGYKARLRAEVGGSKQFYTFTYIDPWLMDTRTTFRFDAYSHEREYLDYTRFAQGGDVIFSYPLDRIIFPNLTASWGYRIEDVEVTDVDEDASTIFKEAEAEGRTLTSELIGGLTYDTRDDYLYPTKGSYTNLSIEFAGIGGDNKFAKYTFTTAWFFPVFWDVVFMARTEVGIGHGWGDDTDLPVFERYFLGGLETMRGFEPGSVGPKDPATGDVIGGDKEVFCNFEFIFPIVKKMELRGVFFYDMGNAYLDTIDVGNFRHAVGGGIRWHSPLGPLRIEAGYKLDRLDDESAFEWAFGLGGSF